MNEPLDPPVPLAVLRAELEKALLDAVRATYANRLVSLAIYGSVARATFSIHSDVDLLIVADDLPDGRLNRVREFDRVEDALSPLLRRTRARGWQLELSPIFKTPAETAAGSPLFLDMTDDAKILYDKEGFFAARLQRLRDNLFRLGSRRIWQDDTWYWDLKPDYQQGDRIEL